MPVRKVNRTCYKYGGKGKKYCGKNARKKAARQGRAIKASQARRRR